MSRKKFSRESGATLVELTISFTVVVFVIFWIVELMLMIYAYNVIADAAKEGVRYAVVRGSYSGSAVGPTAAPGKAPSTCYTNTGPIYARVLEFTNLSLHITPTMTVNVCYLDGSNQPPSRVQVTISYPLIPYFNLSSLPTVNARAQGNIVY